MGFYIVEKNKKKTPKNQKNVLSAVGAGGENEGFRHREKVRDDRGNSKTKPTEVSRTFTKVQEASRKYLRKYEHC